MDFTTLEQFSIIISIISSIVAIILGIYAIKLRRKLNRSQLKTEVKKRSAYKSKKEASDMQKTESFTNSVKNLKDIFFGKK